MKIFTAKKINFTWSNKVTLYKLSKTLFKGECPLKGEIFEVTKEMQIIRIKPEYHKFFKDGYDYIAISDADYFYERLVFAAVKFDETMEKPYGRSSIAIGGQNTMSIDGGNIKTLRKPEVYLRRLGMINGIRFAGIINDNN